VAKSKSANRVFVGYPWKTYRAHWERAIEQLHKQTPVHFMAIGREPRQPAAQLLTKILQAIDRSTAVMFDASAGNPNVALEYGYSRATFDDASIYLFIDENATSSSGPGSPIMSDLAGTVANRFALNDNRLRETLAAIARNHPYHKRFDRLCRLRKYRGGTRRFLIRVIRQLDGQDSILRRELIDNIVHEARKTANYVESYVKVLHKAGLITVSRGNEFSSRVSISA
jgi:hypothetical protein